MLLIPFKLIFRRVRDATVHGMYVNDMSAASEKQEFVYAYVCVVSLACSLSCISLGGFKMKYFMLSMSMNPSSYAVRYSRVCLHAVENEL